MAGSRNPIQPTWRYRISLAAALLAAVLALTGVVRWLRSPAATDDQASASWPTGDASQGLDSLEPAVAREQLPARVERRLIQAVRYLASDELEGRGIGTAGIELAAEYIAGEFSQIGLKMDHFGGSPYQRFARSVKIGLRGRNAASWQGPGAPTEPLTLHEDFQPLSLSGSGSFSLPVVFAGYGITAPEIGYDDYRNIDVQGHAVVVLRHGPRHTDPRGPFQGAEHSPYTHLSSKVANALRHGAAAVVFCTDYATLQKRIADLGTHEPATGGAVPDVNGYDKLLDFQVNGAAAKRQIPVVHVQRRFIDQAVRQTTGSALAELEREMDEQLEPRSRMLAGWRMTGEVHVGETVRELKNVVAALEGRGPLADETIVVGAHYDHLGYGGGGSLASGARAIHHGADDNASGTAAVLELARQLAARQSPLPRRLLFVAFTAEESGLLGSEYYVEHPLVPLSQTIAMLNLDMIGYLRQDRLEVNGSGTAVEFERLLYRLGQLHNLRLVLESSGDGPSDHASFYERGVPVLHLFTGLHANYHRPSDQADRVDYHGLRRITQFSYDLLVDLAGAAQRPQPQTGADDEFLVQRPRPRTPKTNAQPVSWGIVGEKSGEEQGCLIRQVEKWGLAAKFGLRAGDRIVKIGPRSVATPEECGAALQSTMGTNRVPILVRRGAVELELQVAVP